MDNKERVIRKLVEFCKKAEADKTTEERRDTITNTAEEIVNLFAIPVVMPSNLKWLVEYRDSDGSTAYVVIKGDNEDEVIEQFVDDYGGLEWIEINKIAFH